MSERHCNIPIFIPQQACPHQCIYCNQRYISGQKNKLSFEQIKQNIDIYISSVKENTKVQVAFFGGTFTGLPLEEQEAYLKVVKPYIDKGLVDSVRLSTRPDYINKDILDLLKYYNVTDIELGAQSLDDEVLTFAERGHSLQDIENASRLIKSYGFSLGLQMMIGLPKDAKEKSLKTAYNIVSLGAKSTRIYPTLVIDRTPLADLYRLGIYKPLTIDEAVIWTKEIYKVFVKNSVIVLRVGLHPSQDLINGKGFISGPFHVSFFELVLSSIWKDNIESISKKTNILVVNPKDINYVIGYNSCNIKELKRKIPNIKIIQSTDIEQGKFQTFD